LLSFQAGHTKLERFLPENRHKEKKFLNFENWCTLDSGINIGVRLLIFEKKLKEKKGK